MNLRLVGERQINALLYPESDTIQAERPRTRGDCVDGIRPCPWVGCRHHLYLDVHAETGAITLNFPAKDDNGKTTRPGDRRGPEDSAVPVWQLKHSCSLDVADLGGLNGPEMGDLLELTKERIRQIEVSALGHLRGYAGELGHELEARAVYVAPPGPAVVVRTSTRRPPSSPPAPAGGIQLQLLDLAPAGPRSPAAARARPRTPVPRLPQLALWP